MNIEAQILEWLRSKWNPEVVLIGGSRATLDHSPESDWDLYLIGRYPSRTSWSEIFCNEHIDVEFVPIETISDGVLRVAQRPVRALRVLLENAAGLGSSLVTSTAEAFKLAPPPLSPDEQLRRQAEMMRLTAKLVAHGSDPEACFATLAEFHTTALQSWCELTSRWPTAPYRVLPLIRTLDPDLSSALAVIASGKSIADKLVACSHIMGLLWRPRQTKREE